MKTLAEPEVVKVLDEISKEGVSYRAVELSDGTARMEVLSDSGAWVPGGTPLDLFPTGFTSGRGETSPPSRPASSPKDPELVDFGRRMQQAAIRSINHEVRKKQAEERRAEQRRAEQRPKPNPPRK